MGGAYDEYKTHMKARRYREAAALARAESAAAGAPRDAAFWHTREAAALSRSGDHAAALKMARKALEADGTDAYAIYAAAEALSGLGRHAEALEHFREAGREPRLAVRARRKVLDCLKGACRWEELLSGVAGSGLEVYEALTLEAAALAGLERVAEAMERCRRALDLVPHHPAALWQLADLEVAQDGLEAVLARYRRMSRIPSLPPVYREIHASLARRAGQTEEALEAYQALGAQGAHVQRRQAFALAKSGRETEAIPLLEELLRADPGDLYLNASYGAACRRAGRLEQAVNFYATLISLHPDEKTLYGRMARLRRGLESA